MRSPASRTAARCRSSRYTHERHFKAHPHEKEARWAYLGEIVAAFRFHEMMHHHVPIGAARVATQPEGTEERDSEARATRARAGISRRSVPLLLHHTFDFRTAFPPLEDFNLDAYLQSVSDGISEHLLKRNPAQAPLRMHGTDLALGAQAA